MPVTLGDHNTIAAALLSTPPTVTLFGFLNCNKPPGMTSRAVVNVVQRRLNKVKVGHAGTLDPLAEGVLVLGVGPAVRLLPYLQSQPKRYRARFRLGVSTVSGDLEGEITEHAELPIPSRQQIDTAAASLIGLIEQTPPAHSAIHVDGKRAYKRIRAGEEFEMPSRTVRVDSIEVLDYAYPELDLDIVCGGGTYIRTIGLDLAKSAGSIALMSHLRRLGVGPFKYPDAIPIDSLRADELPSLLTPPTAGIGHLPTRWVSQSESERLGHGLCIGAGREDQTESAGATEAAALTQTGHLRAIVRLKDGQWCPHRVFPVQS